MATTRRQGTLTPAELAEENRRQMEAARRGEPPPPASTLTPGAQDRLDMIQQVRDRGVNLKGQPGQLDISGERTALDERLAGMEAREYTSEGAAAARDLRDTLTAERGQPGYTPERVTASTGEYFDPGAAETYKFSDPGAATTYEPERVAGPRSVQVGEMAPVERVQSRDVALPGEAARADFERFGGAQLQTAPAEAVRSRQEGYLGMLEQRAAGRSPSVAEASYLAKLGDAERSALGAASRARGSERGAARLQAIRDVSEGTRRAALDAATLRAGEMASAEQALGTGLGGVRGQDIGQATTQAELQQGAGLQTQRIGAETSQFNAGAANERTALQVRTDAENAARAQEAGLAGAAAANTRTMSEAELRAGVEAGNITREQAAGEINARMGNEAAAAGADATNRRSEFTSAGKTAADAANTEAANKRASEIAAGKTSASQFSATQAQGAATTNQGAGLTAAQLEEQRKRGLASGALEAGGQAIQVSQAELDRKAAMERAKAAQPKEPSFKDKLIGTGLNIVSQGGAAYLTGEKKESDRRLKTDIHPVGGDEIDDFAEQLARATAGYRYKGSDHEETGQIANVLEDSKIGDQIVGKDDRGMRYLSMPEYDTALGAVVGRLHRRLEKIEGGRR